MLGLSGQLNFVPGFIPGTSCQQTFTLWTITCIFLERCFGDCMLTHLHFLTLYKFDAKISLDTIRVIWSQSQCPYTQLYCEHCSAASHVVSP